MGSNARNGTNHYNFLGKETQVATGYIDLQARFYDPTVGRFFQIDPETEGQLEFSQYHYSFNNPIRFSDPDGRFACCGAAVEGFAEGVKEAIVRNVRAVTVDLPQTIQGMASLSSTGGQLEAAVGGTMLYQKTKSDWNTGDTRTRANIVGNVVGEIGIAVAGTKGAGNLGKAGVMSDVAKVGEIAGDLSKTKTVGQQATELVGANANKSRVTLRSEKFQMDVDLKGEAHFDKKTNTSYDTPHTKISPRNYLAPRSQGARYNTSEKHAQYGNTTQQEIRTVRRYLEKQN
ncbi:RHS repeat-associated protein [Dyadobacter jejuensis]|uniref:RHS repeat-associated protein n=1 Tax=Dyadobacter jejuensis TaxID=1082580 RepID=A0A316A6F2_9BACT|nr:RHS repeat-associated protein [Dyadobacter jejuensis]